MFTHEHEEVSITLLTAMDVRAGKDQNEKGFREQFPCILALRFVTKAFSMTPW
jgi:hypothetical protein